MISYTYDTWGMLVKIIDDNGNDVTYDQNSIGNINTYRYRSYRYDNELGLYYLQNRYYSPEWCRFINADGTIGKIDDIISVNMFAYCKNNPINMHDPDGRFAHIFIGAIVGTIVGVAGQLLSDITSSIINKKFQLSNIQTYTGAAIGGFIGGTVTMVAGPLVGLAVGSAVSTAVGQSLENASGVYKRTVKEIAINSGVNAGIGAATAIIPVAKIARCDSRKG